ncbi:MAG: hypothetical protein JWQ04_1135 [Pedosphaera sp.]|nr:hypothetical protein [Pedosphaera sp.]
MENATSPLPYASRANRNCFIPRCLSIVTIGTIVTGPIAKIELF